MKIIQAPNTTLASVAKPIKKIDKNIKNLLKDMEEALYSATDPEGVGLAAPQIGASYQIFIIKEDPEAKLKTFINPKIEKLIDKPEKKKAAHQSKTTAAVKEKAGIDKGVQLEGCLSLKDIWGVVNRSDAVVLSYQDEKGVKHKKTFDGFISVIIQHEVDHLNGILFPKRVLEQKQKLYKSIKNKKGVTEFEEMEI